MKEITLEATIDNLQQVLAVLEEMLDELRCPTKPRMSLMIAVEELFVNIASYAYAPDTGEATVRFLPIDDAKGIEITFIDSGMQYNPLEKDDPDITLPVEERPIGGLGIYMVKKSMDDVRYEYKNDQNVLKITKLF